MNKLKPDLSKPTCRVCLKNKIDEEMSSIFDMDAELCGLRIYEKIECCAGIKLICDNQFPSFICCLCKEFLKISYKFRTTCHSSEAYLKLILESKAIHPKKETQIDFPKVQSTSNESSTNIYKKSDSYSSLVESLKKEENNFSFSPGHYEEPIEEIFSGNESEFWVDIKYADSEESLSCSENIETPEQNFDLLVKEEIEPPCIEENKPSTNKKRPYVRKKKPISASLKTLEISSDGAAIIKEKKPRAKRADKQPHVCEICGNVYKRRHILEHHIKRHSDEKDFECEICGYAFHSNFELRRHMRKHTGSRPYKCSYCPSAFGDHSTLTKHERVHRNERPFKCDICGNCFSYPGVLKRHKLVHTGEKPYKCEICGKCFNDRYHLQSHLKTIQHKNDPRVELLLQNIKKIICETV